MAGRVEEQSDLVRSNSVMGMGLVLVIHQNTIGLQPPIEQTAAECRALKIEATAGYIACFTNPCAG